MSSRLSLSRKRYSLLFFAVLPRLGVFPSGRPGVCRARAPHRKLRGSPGYAIKLVQPKESGLRTWNPEKWLACEWTIAPDTIAT
jgi:hypothetical protein